MSRRESMQYVVLLACTVSLMSHRLSGQQIQLVPVGDTVRVWAPGEDVKSARATVLPWMQTTANFLSLSAPADSMDLPFSTVTRLEVLRGKSTGRGVVMGFAWGGAAGMLVGGVIGSAAVSGCTQLLCELDAVGYAMGGLLIGGVLGAALGAVNPPDRWTRVDLPTSAGFPRARKKFYQTTMFKLMLVVAPIAILAANQ